MEKPEKNVKFSTTFFAKSDVTPTKIEKIAQKINYPKND